MPVDPYHKKGAPLSRRASAVLPTPSRVVKIGARLLADMIVLVLEFVRSIVEMMWVMTTEATMVTA